MTPSLPTAFDAVFVFFLILASVVAFCIPILLTLLLIEMRRIRRTILVRP